MNRASLLLTTFTLCAISSADLVLNGSFEDNTAGGSQFNLTNAQFTSFMANATAFGGSAELDIIEAGGFYSPNPIDGTYKVALHSRGAGASPDAFSLTLSSPLVIGTTYRLRFAAALATNGTPGDIRVGLSQSATSFGSEIFHGAPSYDTWSIYTQTFTATSADKYLTVSSTPHNNAWLHVDNFSLEAVPEPSSMVALGLGGLALIRRRRQQS